MNRKRPIESLPQTPSTIGPQRIIPPCVPFSWPCADMQQSIAGKASRCLRAHQQRVSPLLKTKNNKTHAPVS
jgi:hypothetical protein